MSTYYELLKHPNWQRKRLEILNRDGFACTNCGDIDSPLHVHHGHYERGRKPWEYEDITLHTFCEDCHRIAQERLSLLYLVVARMSQSEIERVLGYAAGVNCNELNMPVSSDEFATGAADAFGLKKEQFLELLRGGTVRVEEFEAMAKVAS